MFVQQQTWSGPIYDPNMLSSSQDLAEIDNKILMQNTFLLFQTIMESIQSYSAGGEECVYIWWRDPCKCCLPIMC